MTLQNCTLWHTFLKCECWPKDISVLVVEKLEFKIPDIKINDEATKHFSEQSQSKVSVSGLLIVLYNANLFHLMNVLYNNLNAYFEHINSVALNGVL